MQVHNPELKGITFAISFISTQRSSLMLACVELILSCYPAILLPGYLATWIPGYPAHAIGNFASLPVAVTLPDLVILLHLAALIISLSV
jgi:hypothetical protein